MFTSRRLAIVLSVLVATASALLQQPQKLSTGITYSRLHVLCILAISGHGIITTLFPLETKKINTLQRPHFHASLDKKLMQNMPLLCNGVNPELANPNG